LDATTLNPDVRFNICTGEVPKPRNHRTKPCDRRG